MQPDEGVPAEVQVRTNWGQAADVPVQVANQFIAQIGAPVNGRPDGVHLLIGHISPPLLIGGDAQDTRRQIEELGGQIPVTVHDHLFLTRERLGELVGVLQDIERRYDEILGKATE
ncbi:hypothetical protein AB0N89_22300 [Amycolatopsis sp. NPDC089917]|uniref:hypothetical protein n=1 Tax=Amycolatopsis sp. NPDC089917 TaxID=3155187 RepID=UPI0034371C94